MKLPPSETIPLWALNCNVFSITRTDEELSVVCPSECLQINGQIKEVENDWKYIKVEGVLDFSLTGILSSLANSLAKNKISIFVILPLILITYLLKAIQLKRQKSY